MILLIIMSLAGRAEALSLQHDKREDKNFSDSLYTATCWTSFHSSRFSFIFFGVIVVSTDLLDAIEMTKRLSGLSNETFF